MIKITLLGEKDHGKSTLLGRLLYDTKSFPEDRLKAIKDIAQNSKKRFEWAHILDSFRYERENEMTLDTTRAIAKIGKESYEFIDVPGHKELIKNMLSGASDAEFGILLIDATEGITKQTLEHLAIGKFLKLKKIIVAVNKIDKIRNIKKALSEAKSRLGSGFIFVPISAYSGKNVDKLCKAITKNFKPPKNKKVRGYVAVIQDVYGKNVALKILEGKIKKGKMKYSANLKRGDILSDKKINLTDSVSADCVFVEKPDSKNLRIEANFKEVGIINLKTDRGAGFVQKTELSLSEKIYIHDKFSVKSAGKVIGLCRV